MQTIYAYSYNPTIATGTNSTGTNWRMAYQQPIMLYKGTSNSVRLVVFNVNQKIVNLTGYNVQVQLVDRETQEHFVTKIAVVSAPTSGVATITFNELDLRNLEHRFYHLIARLVNPDDGSSITSSEILYLDDNYGAFTTVTIENAWNYAPGTISTVEGPLLTVGNIIPISNDTYWLGNVTNQWHSLYANTANINSITTSEFISSNADFIQFIANSQILKFYDNSTDPTHFQGDGGFLTFFDTTHQNDGPRLEIWYGDDNAPIYDPPGQHSLDIHAAANSYVELASHDLNSFIGVDDIGPFIQTQWLNDPGRAWRFFGDGELRLPSAGSKITSENGNLQIIMTFDDIRFVRTDIDGSTLHSTIYDSNGDIYNDGDLLPGSFTPDPVPIHSLGSPSHPWKDLHLSNSTIYLGGIPISVSETGNLTVSGIPVSTESQLGKFKIENDGDTTFLTTIVESGFPVGYNITINPSGEGSNITIPNQANAEAGDPLIIAANANSAVEISTHDSTWAFGMDGKLTLPGNVQFTDNSIQSTAYQFSAQDTGPELSPGSLWYNSDEGRLYINYNDTWLDASPTQIDPSALRANQDSAVELPSGLTFNPANLYIPADGTMAFQNANEGLQIFATGIEGMSAFGWARNPITNVGGASAILFNAMEPNGAVILSGNSTSPKYWSFEQTGNLTLPEGGIIKNNDGTPYGGTSTGDITFSNVQIIGATTNNGNGSIELVPNPSVYGAGQYLNIYPTSGLDAPHIHIAAGSGGDLLLGNDTYNIDINNDESIRINTTGGQWKFKTDGAIVFPDNTVQNTAYIDWTPVLIGTEQLSHNSFRRSQPFNYNFNYGVYSKEGYTRGCFVSGTLSGSLGSFGLSSKPGCKVDNIDYQFVSVYNPDNRYIIRENGVDVVLNAGPLSSSTVAKIVYDGTNVIYYLDDVVIRTVARPIGAPLHLDSAFYYDPIFGNVKFGPYGNQTSGVGIPSKVPTTSIGSAGDLQGMVAFNGSYIYYCTQDFVEASYSSTITSTHSGTFPSIVKGSIPQPQAGWVLVHNGNTYTLDANAFDGNPGEWVLSLSSSISVTIGDSVTVGPASVPNIWKRVTWSGDTW